MGPQSQSYMGWNLKNSTVEAKPNTVGKTPNTQQLISKYFVEKKCKKEVLDEMNIDSP